MNELLKISFNKSKNKRLEVIQDRSERLDEYEREKELDKIRDLLINQRMVQDIKQPTKHTVKGIIEITDRITDVSPLMKKALNYDELVSTTIKTFNFEASDVLNYLMGRKQKLFDKIKIVDPIKFKKAQMGSDLSVLTHHDMPDDIPENPRKLSTNNALLFEDYRKGLNFDDEIYLRKNVHKQTYLTDGYFTLKDDYNYMNGKYLQFSWSSRMV